jgi:hypothetical protein
MNEEDSVEATYIREIEKNIKENKADVNIFDFFKINLLTYLLPFYICLGIFLAIESLLFIVLEVPIYIHFLIFPVLFLFLYYVYIIVLIEVCALWVSYWNNKSPPLEGIFPRNLDENTPEGKLLKYYHKRGFIIKFPVWLAKKSPFPWLINRVLRRIGHNQIGENVLNCDNFVGLEFTRLGDNSFLYPSSAISSHAVNSIFGKISIIKVKFAKDTTLYPNVIAGPGSKTKEDYIIYPNTVLHKNWRGKENVKYYQGSPGKPIKTKSKEKK